MVFMVRIKAENAGSWSAILGGAMLLLLLIELLYPIYRTSAFSSNYFILAYNSLFALALRLLLAGKTSRVQKFRRAVILSTLTALMFAPGTAAIGSIVDSAGFHELGLGGYLIVTGYFNGVPIVLLTCLFSLIPWKAKSSS